MKPQSPPEASVHCATPQVKICGLTLPEEAAACADLGADAIGLIFFPKSPRHLSVEGAGAVVAALPRSVPAVGVFVNATFDAIMDRVDRCGLRMVQLHGRENPELVDRLRSRGIGVVKALFVDGRPGFPDRRRYHADAFLAECARGPLPGGNAMVWDWRAARALRGAAPLVLAGGLSPDNVRDAVHDALPAAVDVSSGVEIAPGRKDLVKVARLLEAVRQTAPFYAGSPPTPVFGAGERTIDG